MQRLTSLFAVLLAVPLAAHAQETNALRNGVRLEITPINGKTQKGRLMAVRNDSLYYAPSGVAQRSISESAAASVAFADVKSVRVSRGRNVLLSAFVHGLIGTAIGAGTGALIAAATWSEKSNDFFCGGSRGACAAFGGVVGSPLGLIAGTIYGLATGYDRWQSVPLPGQ